MNEERCNRRPVLWMAGDSTMQSYSEEQRPQWGWGECLAAALEKELDKSHGRERNIPVNFHREDCSFPQERRYEGKYFELDNCAMAGRSSKTFREEGRLKDIAEHIQEGDYLLIQFGHNDAGSSKPERYVSLEDFKASLAHFAETALSQGATPIFLSSIVLCPGSQIIGEALAISELLPVYGKVMEDYATELNCPYIDMNQLTGIYLKSLTEEQQESLYKQDHVHLVHKGAETYAGLAAKELVKYIEMNAESSIKKGH